MRTLTEHPCRSAPCSLTGSPPAWTHALDSAPLTTRHSPRRLKHEHALLGWPPSLPARPTAHSLPVPPFPTRTGYAAPSPPPYTLPLTSPCPLCSPIRSFARLAHTHSPSHCSSPPLVFAPPPSLLPSSSLSRVFPARSLSPSSDCFLALDPLLPLTPPLEI